MIILTRERRIDWARIIDNLRKLGMSEQEIADALDVARTSVQGYCDDRCIEPAFWVGSSLLVLWSSRTGVPYTDAPTRRVLPSVSQVLKASA
jgi:DNA-binding transcriptional MerR regulator